MPAKSIARKDRLAVRVQEIGVNQFTQITSLLERWIQLKQRLGPKIATFTGSLHNLANRFVGDGDEALDVGAVIADDGPVQIEDVSGAASRRQPHQRVRR